MELKKEKIVIEPIKAIPTVTVTGKRLQTVIDGVKIQQQVTQQDDRGTLTEIYSPFWAFDTIPLVYIYTVSVHPAKIKGWAVHSVQTDRYFFYTGSAKLVLYDSRPESSTYGMINEFYFSETNRSIVLVPPHIYHAVQNVGTKEVLLLNFPSHAYKHDDPDKYILPLDNNLIPYQWNSNLGY
ncbi:MAG: dTDP-4-dehydrorhamnose 3,5-epimerase [uncultured bacterium]|nr:MAG: dTDP-4-dehydrorhamnose 3,5-epimerase [uncultured bacterium]